MATNPDTVSAAAVAKLIGQPAAFWPRAIDADLDDENPRPATIAHVTDATAGHMRVNLAFLELDGTAHNAENVPLYESGDRPATAYAELPATVGKATRRAAEK